MSVHLTTATVMICNITFTTRIFYFLFFKFVYIFAVHKCILSRIYKVG